jgi:hypothetical protein
MAALEAAIQPVTEQLLWMAGSSPAMTIEGSWGFGSDPAKS